MTREVAVSALFLLLAILPVSSCLATTHALTSDDIPDLVIQSITGDDRVDWNSIDTLIRLCESPDGLDALAGCLDGSSPVIRLETIPVLGKMAYRLIGDDPDSDLLLRMMSLLAPMVDVDDEEVQLAAIRAIRTVLSSEIDFGTTSAPMTRPGNVSPHNKYFAISIRACVGGLNSEYDSVPDFTHDLLDEIGFSGFGGFYNSNTYTFETSVGSREYAELVLDNLNLTLEQYIEYRLDLAEYTATLGNGFYYGASFYSFGQVFNGHPPEEIAGYLDHWSPGIRGYAREALSQLGASGMPFLNQVYENGNPRVRLELLEVVSPDATEMEKFEHFDRVIHDPDSPVSNNDSRLFNVYIRDNEITSPDDYPFDVMTFLKRLLDSEQTEDLNYAIVWSGEFGPDAVELVPDLINLLEMDSRELAPYTNWPGAQQVHTIASYTAVALGKIGPAASDAIPYLLEIRDRDPGIPEICVTTALYGIGYHQDEMVAWLVDRINTESDTQLLPVIAENLEWVGPDAIAAVPRLIELTEHPDIITRYNARDAITAIEGSPDTVVGLLVEKLDSDVSTEREEAARVLYNMCDKSDLSNSASSILQSLDDESFIVRQLSCMTLVTIGGYENEVVPVIIDLLSENHEQGMYIVRLLRDIGRPAADPAEQAVLEMILSINNNNIQNASQVYRDIWGVTEKLLDVLVELGTDFDNTLYFQGLDTLSDIGEEASSTLPALRASMEGQEQWIIDKVQSIIDAIEADMENTDAE